MQKPQKQCHALEESCFESDFAGYHDKTLQQIRKQHKPFKIITVGRLYCRSKNLIFIFFTLVVKTNRISRM